MANYFNHTRYRKRTYEYSQLNLKALKRYAAYPTGTTLTLSWSNDGEACLKLKVKRTDNGLFIFTSTERGYLIPIEQTTVTFGKRLWYRCPNCERRCGILYHAQVFACRHCVKPSYESQNGSQPEYLASRIRKARRKLWGDNMGFFTDDLLESCSWFPKPSQIHQQRFERDRANIIMLEGRHYETIPIRFRHLIFR